MVTECVLGHWRHVNLAHILLDVVGYGLETPATQSQLHQQMDTQSDTQMQSSSSPQATTTECSSTAGELQWPELPMPIIWHILDLLPCASKALAVKLVDKAAYRRYRYMRLSVSSPDMPRALLEERYELLRELAGIEASGDSPQDERFAVVNAWHFVHQPEPAWQQLTAVEKQRRLAAGRAACGSLQDLQWLRSHSCELDDRVYVKAAMGGHVHVLQWAHAQGLPCPMRREYPSYQQDFATSLCSIAARRGHLEVLQWACSLHPGLHVNKSLCNEAAEHGHPHILQWLRAQDPPCPWDITVCYHAASKGHLAVLQWARSQDPPCPWNEDTCEAAAFSGHLSVLQWLRAQDPPCPWNGDVCDGAIAEGHLAVLQWARAQNPPCPWNDAECLSSCWCMWGDTVNAEVLLWALSQNSPLPLAAAERRAVCYLAAYNGSLPLLQWARSQDPPLPWDEDVCRQAAYNGRLDILQWARAQDPPCPWNWHEVCNASRCAYGRLELWEWLLRQERPDFTREELPMLLEMFSAGAICSEWSD